MWYCTILWAAILAAAVWTALSGTAEIRPEEVEDTADQSPSSDYSSWSDGFIHFNGEIQLPWERQTWQQRRSMSIYEKNRQLQELNKILFPDSLGDTPEGELPLELPLLVGPTTTPETNHQDDSGRQLQISKEPYSKNVPCVICRGLDTCKILNGYQLEEVYYPRNLHYLETCTVMEALGNRVKQHIFGPSGTFRDTVQCRDIVMQYLCLFYGSDNPMYRNYCIYQEDVTDPNPANHKVAPRAPCRSFCVQVARVCANDPDFFIQTCQNIPCPPVEDECTPDPILNGQVLDSKIGCAVPYYTSPYFRSSAPLRANLSTGVLAITLLISLLLTASTWVL